ncbi:anthranilate synthase family protein [Streptomyces huiliensis]|uniref:anthranilate synthase family protein n=1 Tax=Streptomyces huiliensis TaxID=2876027 RepID=UPI001CBAC5A3|nr:anthranilate synthase family protein [Streptomyces huiliensis]MBZ4323665.1 anthranilate synthase family protein [Streptomyces huiliensis]
MTARELLARITGPTPPDFALLHRGGAAAGDRIDVLVGTTAEADTVADIPLPAPGGRDRHEVLALLPYRQIRERGYDHPDDGAPLLALTVTGQAALTRAEALEALPDGPITLRGGDFDHDDERYAATVRRIIDEEIGRGNGANFVIKRSFVAEIADWSVATALTFFRRLLGGEPGAYWTFVVRAGGRTFVGASPERHVSLDRGTVVMNPISGTYRYPPQGPTPAGVLEFLSDTKEANELYMVLDEELKMMGRLCEGGGRVVGPYLKEMARVAHTEYLIEGRSRLDAREILGGTLFAPTVTGSPLESACHVISRYEPEGRGYYAGVAALFGRDADGGQTLDSAILIRTADVDADGRMTLSVGSTLVRDSTPASEAAETRAKAAGLLAALRGEGPARPGTAAGGGVGEHPEVRRVLAERNTPLADFWLADPAARAHPLPGLTGRDVLVLDAEDTFTAMAHHMLAAHGLRVSVRRFDEDYRLDGHDLVVLGPGPGDPRDHDHPKIRHIRGVAGQLLASGQPFMAVCLGHQVLSTVLGLDIVRRAVPNQGVQRKIEAFGRTELVGFYNTFAASSATDSFPCPVRGGTVHVHRDPENDEVHALRGPGFASVQFHPASVLTRNGVEFLGTVMSDLMAGH